MSSISWKINRLKAMSVPEILWRLSQKRIQRIERKKFCDKGIFVTDHVFNNDLMKFSFDADKLGINKNNTNFELGTDIRLLAGADYKKYKKKWNAGFQTINCWPNTFSYDLEYRQRDDIGDARTNWELNRHFQFTLLAKNYYITGKKEYLDEFIDLFDDWNNKNPFLHGISWTSVMEVAIRCSNWCYSLAFLSYMDAPENLTRKLCNGILNMTEYIENHYSRYSSANNHLIVEAYAIGQSGILFGNQYWVNLAVEILTRELSLQNFYDGVNKEASLHYQSFYMEAMGLMMRLLLINNISIPKTWISMLDKMSRFVTDCMGNYGEVIEFGDNDEGKILDLMGKWTDHYQYVLGMMSIMLGEQYTSDFECETLHWLFSDDAIDNVKKKKRYVPAQYCCYKEGGYSIIRSIDRKTLIGIDHAELGYGPIAAHGHADALSFQLFYMGEPVFIDPGTYIYHCDINSRNEFRKTYNHNTICIDDKNQSQMIGPFLWGDRAHVKLLEVSNKTKDGVFKLIIEHDGYKPIVHKRIIEFDGRNVFIIEDEIKGTCGAYELTFAISPKWVLELDNGNVTITKDGSRIVLDISSEDECEVGFKPLFCSKKYGCKEKTRAIYIKPKCNKARVKIRISEK